MKAFIKQATRLAGVALLILALGTSCKKDKQSQEADSSEYANRLEEQAQKLNEKCPKQLKNGLELISVSFKDNTQLYRYRVTDQQIVTINLDQARDSIVASLTENEKEYLIKGKCSQEHRFISPNDSSSITIIPKELKRAEEDDEDKDDD